MIRRRSHTIQQGSVLRSPRWDQDIARPREHVAPIGGGHLTERIKIVDVQTPQIQPAPVAAGAIMDEYVGVANIGTSWWEQPQLTSGGGFHKRKIRYFTVLGFPEKLA